MMLAMLGQSALILAFISVLLQLLVAVSGVVKNSTPLMRLMRPLSFTQFFLITVSFSSLVFSFVSNDFSLSYVAANSNTALPLIYRVCAAWGGHEGSILLWVFMLALWSVWVAVSSQELPLKAVTLILGALAFVAGGFYLFILLNSNPFVQVSGFAPFEGRDLNPLLQDPGLVSHPPLLYLGYVGMAVPFACAIAVLLLKKFEMTLALALRKWVTLAWSFLTLGIVLGSWWAYRELGWGGWWFWDPVENASLLPWLVATALIHSLMLVEKRKTFKSWTVLLCVCGFGLSLIGTFLVRSGILISVHAFANDPGRGHFILCFLLLTIGGALLLYALRSHYLVESVKFKFFSREFFLGLNNLLLFVMMLCVLLGTVYPIVVDLMGWGKLSVGAPYFNTVMTPLLIPLVLSMGLGPLLTWGGQELKSLRKRLIALALVSLLLSIIVPVFLFKSHYEIILGLFLGFWLLLTTLYSQVYMNKSKITWRKLPAVFAHLGLSVMIVAVVLVSSYSEERDVRLRIGEGVTLHQHFFKLAAVEAYQGPNYQAARASVRIGQGQHEVTELHPEYRVYPAAQMTTSKTAMAINWRRDLYVALGRLEDDNAWMMRIYYEPFVRWIWYGGLLMVLGGVLSLFLRKKND